MSKRARKRTGSDVKAGTEGRIDAVIYTRFSSDHQDPRSNADQEHRCRDSASRHGWNIVDVYSDSAISGKKESRPALDRLLADAKTGRFSVVLIDDVSRLTRAGTDVMASLRRQLEKSDVSLYDAQTGMSTSQPGARLMFGIKAAVAENYLEQLAYQIQRGQANRARSGFVSTGGPTLGYRNIDEPNPPDPKHVRKVQVIDPEGAKLVLRIFKMYASGMAYRQIAMTLNEEGIPAPRDGQTTVKSANGWTHAPISYMLHNPVYRGVLIRTIGNETISLEKPELRIIDEELWARVSNRFQPSTGGRPPGSKKHPTLIAGLLKCGVCGGTITLAQRTRIRGGNYAYYGCTNARTRGAKICTNKHSLSERKLSAGVVGALQDAFADPKFIAAFVSSFNKRLPKSTSKVPSAEKDLERDLAAVEARIANLVNAIAALGLNKDLEKKLKGEQEKRDALRAHATKAAPAAPVHVPSSKDVAHLTSDLMKIVTADADQGREILSRYLGPVTVTPTGDSYRLKGTFNIGALLAGKNRGKGGSDFSLKTTSASDSTSP